ncbi:MAG: glycosyltransferase family 39 protein [Ignavibacteria bacterium]|nr:glycosyltransferase family 39 protein [Ignavibacteria bacterium]
MNHILKYINEGDKNFIISNSVNKILYLDYHWNLNDYTKSKEYIYGFVILLILLLKFIASFNTGLFEDEAIYWNWSQTIDASYSLTTVAFIKLFTVLFSSSAEIIVRLPALISNLMIVFFIFKTGQLLNTRMEMIFTAIITFLSIPFVTIYSLFISPDTFLLTFSVVSIYYLLRALKFDKIQDWILSGFFSGFMVLSKYTASLFLIAVALSLLMIFKKFPKNSLYLFLTAFIISLPLLVWNILNEPVWFKYYLLTDADKIDSGLLQASIAFLLSQISILMPFGFILIIALAVTMFQKKLVLPELLLLKYLSLILIVISILFSLTGKIKGNWFFISYIPLLFFLLTIELKSFLKILTTLVVGFNFLLLIVMNLPAEKIESLSSNKAAELIDKTFAYYWPDHINNINNDYSWSDRIIKMKNWKNAVNQIEDNINNSGTEYDFIASNDFNLCPLLEYYFNDKKEIYLIGDLRFRYINSAESFANLKGKDAVIVTYGNSSQNLLQNKFEYLKDIDNVNFKMPDNTSKDFKLIYGKSFLPDFTINLK